MAKVRIAKMDMYDADHDALFDTLTNDILEAIQTSDNTQTDVANYLRETGRWVLDSSGSMLYLYEKLGFDVIQDGRTTRITIA